MLIVVQGVILKKPGRENYSSRAHPGQIKGSARKRRLRRERLAHDEAAALRQGISVYDLQLQRTQGFLALREQRLVGWKRCPVADTDKIELLRRR